MGGSSKTSSDAVERPRPKTTRTLLRGLAVLETLSEADRGLGPTEIASLVELDKGTVSRLLQTLTEAGYVNREPSTRTYVLSTKILRLAQGLRQQLDLRSVAHPHLSELCSEVQETVHLGVRDERQVVYVHKVEPQNQTIRMVSSVGQSMPLATTALGKAMLASYPATMLDEALTGLEFATGTKRSIKDRAAFESEIERTRSRGFAVDDQENEENIICVGAAIVGENGVVCGAISITSPAFRAQDRIELLGSMCRKTAEAISRAVGGGRIG